MTPTTLPPAPERRTLAQRFGVTVRPLRADDLPALAVMRGGDGHSPRLDDVRTATWQYARHPLRERGPTLWGAFHGSELVGHQGAIPCVLTAGGDLVDALWAVDLFVLPEWRLRGVGPALMDAVAEAAPVVLALGITPAARRAYLRSGWLDLGMVPRMLRPLVPTTLVRRALLSRGVSRRPAPGRTSFRALDAALAGVQRRRGYRLNAVERIGHEAEVLWRRLALDGRVTACRDQGFLQWRFGTVPGCEAIRSFALLRHGEFRGYAVARLGPGRGGLHLELLDYLAGEPDLGPLLRLLMVSDIARSAVAVEVTTLPGPGAHVFRRLGFLPREPDLRFMVRTRADAARLRETVANRARWLVTMADGDNRFPAGTAGEGGPDPTLR